MPPKTFHMIKILLFSFLLTSSCGTNKIATNNIQNHWIHSFEEDEKGIKLFRLSNFVFKPSRGREEIKLLKEGKLEYRPISPNDEPIFYNGTWIIKGKRLILKYNNQIKEYKIIELNKEYLKLK